MVALWPNTIVAICDILGALPFPSQTTMRLCAIVRSFPRPAVASLSLFLLFEPYHSKYTKLCVCKTVKLMYSLKTPVSSNRKMFVMLFFSCFWIVAVDSSDCCSARGRDRAARCSQWACARLAVYRCRRIGRRNCPSCRCPRQGLGTSRQRRLLVGEIRTR